MGSDTLYPRRICYHETSDLVPGFPVEEVNENGLPSYKTKSLYGGGYAPRGLRSWNGYGDHAIVRRLAFDPEGYHDTIALVVFQVVRSTPALSATLALTTPISFGKIRGYMVDSDNYRERFIDRGGRWQFAYQSAYCNEHIAAYRYYRRYWHDSDINTQPHLAVVYSDSNAPLRELDFTAAFNQVMARPGWRAGNKMAFGICMDGFYPQDTHFLASLDPGNVPPVESRSADSRGGPYHTISNIHLTLTY